MHVKSCLCNKNGSWESVGAIREALRRRLDGTLLRWDVQILLCHQEDIAAVGTKIRSVIQCHSRGIVQIRLQVKVVIMDLWVITRKQFKIRLCVSQKWIYRSTLNSAWHWHVPVVNPVVNVKGLMQRASPSVSCLCMSGPSAFYFYFNHALGQTNV